MQFWLICLVTILAISSCSSDPYLYDRPGFDAGTMPRNSSGARMVPPDSYGQQQQYGGGNAPYSQQGYQAQNPYPPQPQPQQQYQQQPYYPPQVAPGSRFYSNPYAIPPSNQQYPYYDGDQYYVPPTYYNNIEQNNAPRMPMRP